jgi:CheY-like chemotaxis protein
MQAPLTALLLCNDDQALDVIDRTFEEYSVSTYICMGGESAQTSASQKKFDLLMLDFDEPEALRLVDFRAVDLWGYPSVVIAITSNPATVKQQALGKRVHFVLQKPFTPELLGRTLKAGYSLIVNEKRSALRHAVSIPAEASFLENNSRNPLENASIQNISLNGICLQTDSIVSRDATVFVDFVLPESQHTTSVIGKVMWCDNTGHVGMQFRFIPPLEQERLRGWLSTRCPWDVELRPKSFGKNTIKAVAVPRHMQ